jgi:hypothetical protein
MKTILLLLLIPSCTVYSQGKERIFRIESESNNTVGYSYNVNVLSLSANKEYSLIEQKYLSKKFSKKNIPFNFSKTYGVYNIKNDTLRLFENETKKELLFVMKKKYLIYLFNNEEATKFRWTKIDY